MLSEAKELLLENYQKSLDKVKSDNRFVEYTNEKYVHSQQVLGAGNYILKHEPFFIKQSAEFIELARTVLILHDISRFDEIVAKFNGVNDFDHGVKGAEKLSKTELFGDIRITLPIKHHGHMIEEFYADAEFQKITDAKLKEEITQLIFMVRDADKIANFQLLCTSRFAKWHCLFFSGEDTSRPLNDMFLRDFMNHKIISRKYVKNKTEQQLDYLSWFYDINYLSAFDFCHKLKLDKKLITDFPYINQNHAGMQPLIACFNNFIQTKLSEKSVA